MNIRELNEKLDRFVEAQESAWDTLKRAKVDSILQLEEILQFYTTKRLWELKLEPTENKEEGVVVAVEPNTRMLRYVMYQNGKEIDRLGTPQNPLYFKINDQIIDLSTKQAQQAMRAGVNYVTNSYGAHQGNCKEVLAEYGIDVDTIYVVNDDVMAASKPGLRWMPVDQYLVCVIGQHGKGFYNIPVEQFNDYAKPQTDSDRNKAVFIASQD